MEKLVLKIAAKILNRPMESLKIDRPILNGAKRVVLWFESPLTLDGKTVVLWVGSGSNEIQMLRDVRARGAKMIAGW